MSEEIDWITLSGRKAKGKRPEFFDDPAMDRLYSMVLAMAAEVSSLRERQDTLERLLEVRGMLRREEVEDYVPDLAAGRDRAIATHAYISRIMRGFQQALEEMESNDPPISHWVETLAKD